MVEHTPRWEKIKQPVSCAAVLADLAELWGVRIPTLVQDALGD
jgi:hypothetical protein